MAFAQCTQCGRPNPEAAKFCGGCGATLVPILQGKTMLGNAFPQSARAAQTEAVAPHDPVPGPTPPAVPRAAVRGAIQSSKHTLFGVARPIASLEAAAPAPATSPERLPPLAGTMLGVARPGIAPTNAPEPEAAAAAAGPTGPEGLAGTILGVAIPGIAPVDRARGRLPALPAPPPLVEDPLPAPPISRPKTGFSLAVVAGVIAVAVLLVGGAVAVLSRRAPSISAKASVNEKGEEVIHIQCASCADGTRVSVGEKFALLASHEGEFVLPKPLALGDNVIPIRIDRPGVGRDETVNLALHVAYRIHADLTEVAAAPPRILVRVSAERDDSVVVNGARVPLDAKGEGVYVVDIRAETEGVSDETRVIDRALSYAITPKANHGTPSTGTVTARVAVAPLQIETPGARVVLTTSTFSILGRTLKGGSVAANGKALHVNPDGTFTQTLESPAGETIVEVSAAYPSFASRIAKRVIRHVTDVDAEGRSLEAGGARGYDAVMSNIEGNIGQTFIAEGAILETRPFGHGSIFLLDDHRDCAHGPCLVRVINATGSPVAQGNGVRAYGTISRAFVTPTGSKIPELDAELFLPQSRSKGAGKTTTHPRDLGF